MLQFMRNLVGVKADKAVQAGVEALVRWTHNRPARPRCAPWNRTSTNLGNRWRGHG